MSKKLILVVCGAGTLTSVVAAQGIREGLEKKGLSDFEVKTGRIDEVERLQDQISVLVSTMNLRQKYAFPVVNAIAFLTGDESGMEKAIDKVAECLQKE
ncbi:PTS sucrose transporter subunit IIABC [Caproiciproducens sp.]